MQDSQWARHRTEMAQVQAERLQQRKEAEHRRAGALLNRFVEVATKNGPAPHPLRVLGYGGRSSARTPLHGWYLRRDRTSAVGTDGNFYVLTAPLSLIERLRGTHPEPRPAPLVLGAGGKDGDSIELHTALERLLPGWQEIEQA